METTSSSHKKKNSKLWKIPFEVVEHLEKKIGCYDINVLSHRNHGIVLEASMITPNSVGQNEQNNNSKKVVIKLSSLETRKRKETFKREVKVHIKLQKTSKKIIKLLYAKRIQRGNEASVGMIIMEKLDLDLMDYILSSPSIPITNIKKLFKHICQSVLECHNVDVVHLDLKPENILLSMNGDATIVDAKLCDFGCSLNFSSSSSSPSSTEARQKDKSLRKLKNYFKPGTFGTLQYLAPEYIPSSSSSFGVFSTPFVMNHSSIYSNEEENDYSMQAKKIDVYSLGVILFMMVSKRFPKVYSEHEDPVVHCLVNSSSLQGSYFECLKSFNPECTEDCAHLVSCMMNDNAALRPTLEEVLLHPFFS